MRGRFATGAIALWGFALNLALTKGWLDWCPNWGIALMLGIPLIIWAWIGLTHDRFKNYLKRTTPMAAITAFILVGAIIGAAGGGVIYTLLKRPLPATGVTNSVGGDLRMTVTSYRYSSETKELIAHLQLVNNGPMRRIVMGAMFTYKPPGDEQDQNTRHYIIESMEELRSQGDLQTPIYVEPGQPIVATFRHKVVDETPLNTPGTVFGIEVNSLTAAGGRNTTWVDVMEAVGDFKDPTKVTGHLTGRKETISLDVPWGNNPMETQSQLRARLEAKATPAAAPATPSATAKSPLDRLKIRDTPDGPVLEVENLPATPTPIEHKKSLVVVPPPPTPSVLSSASPSQGQPAANLTPAQLFDLTDGRTPLQTAKLIEQYKGLWTEVEGETTPGVWPQGNGCAVTIPLSAPEGKLRHVECRFDKSDVCEKLDRLERKAVIKARGKIVSTNGQTLALSDCELISPTPP